MALQMSRGLRFFLDAMRTPTILGLDNDTNVKQRHQN